MVGAAGQAAALGARSPVMVSLIAHRRSGAPSARASAFGCRGLHLSKYLPLTPSTSGDDAR